MALPDYQSLMLPLLLELADKQEHIFRDIIEALALCHNLTDEERKEMLPSGQQSIFVNRVGWAKTYLKKAGLLDIPRRGAVIITQRGLDILKQNPLRIDVRLLRRFPEFMTFYGRGSSEGEEPVIMQESTAQTPEEILESVYQQLRNSLAQELLNKIAELSPSFFEQLVVELLVKMGYGGSIKDAGHAIGKSGDEGIDGTIKEDKLGLDMIYIQAKRWQPGNVIGRPEIQRFVGALAGQGAKKGVFITTSSFTKEAKEYLPRNETRIVLIDGGQLARLMIDHNLGVTVQQIYEVKKIDGDYFGEE